jgi:dimethylamine/trimethylamine dehydrogenase
MPDADYRASLVRCYEEELINEAYFLAVAQRLPSEMHRDKLALLAEVERIAAAAIHPLLILYGLVPRDVSVLHTLGRGTVERKRSIDWEWLIQDIVSEYPKFVDQFHALEQIAPTTDLAMLERLTEHEVATIEFAKREQAGDADSLHPIRSYLDRCRSISPQS